jgi:hypothetical protein
MSPVLEALLGSRSAAQALLFIEAYGAGHANGMARIYHVPVNGLYRQLRRLEDAGVLVSRTVGGSRRFEFNPRNPTVTHLRAFLAEELESLPRDEVSAYYRERQRPRRTGKAL